MKIHSREASDTGTARHKRIGKIAYTAWTIALAFAAVCVSSELFQKFILRQNHTGILGISAFVIVSGSMEPTLSIHDIVVVREVGESEISNGDVITFYDKTGNVITHRVNEISAKDGKTYYATKGDANNSNDAEPVENADVIGRYCFALPGAGRIIAAIVSPSGIALSVLLFALVCLVLFDNSRNKPRVLF